MKNGSAPIRWTGVLIAVMMVSIYLTASGGSALKEQLKDTAEARADIISIDSMKVFGKLERPPVTFLHQKHTKALEKKYKDCTTCHLSEKNRMSTKFMRFEDTTRQKVMDIYHLNCVTCHRKTASAEEKSGPVVCGECHSGIPTAISSWQPIGMDKSLHYRHVKANQEKCELCHHEYNEVTKKLFYAKGKEATCRYCHKKQTEDNRISLPLAFHTACVSCHRETLAKNENAGPIFCNGCHNPSEQKLIEKVETVPRMKMNQPDIAFIKTGNPEEDLSYPPIRMKRVPFNHLAHENYNDTCRICHHADLKACAQCHTLPGSKNGDYVELEQAMHRLKVEQSCLGCHQNRQRDKQCAGCHISIENRRLQDPSTCRNCHMGPLPQTEAEAQQQIENMKAAVMLESRETSNGTYDNEDIPENVVIQSLVNKYDPVKLPHRKIVNTLVNNIKDNKMANYFHHEKGTVCQGCHHNTPATRTPPKCSSCHGRPFNEKDPFKPGLMAAFHRQCMECHAEMGIVKPVATDCTACHRERA